MSDYKCTDCGSEYSYDDLGIDNHTNEMAVFKKLGDTECPDCGSVGEWEYIK